MNMEYKLKPVIFNQNDRFLTFHLLNKFVVMTPTNSLAILEIDIKNIYFDDSYRSIKIDGAVPTYSLNWRLKKYTLSYPQISATCVTEYRLERKRSHA